MKTSQLLSGFSLLKLKAEQQYFKVNHYSGFHPSKYTMQSSFDLSLAAPSLRETNPIEALPREEHDSGYQTPEIKSSGRSAHSRKLLK